jgi:hypothetical protein
MEIRNTVAPLSSKISGGSSCVLFLEVSDEPFLANGSQPTARGRTGSTKMLPAILNLGEQENNTGKEKTYS